MNQASATLIATGKIDREGLSHLTTPEATRSWRPIPHYELVMRLDQELTKRGIRIEKEDLAVAGGGKKLFGVFVLSFGDTGEHRAAIGLRAANDRTMAIQMCVGTQILVCENMAFGSTLALSRKHTSKVELPREIEGAVNIFEERYRVMSDSIDRLKAIPVTDDLAKVVIYDAIVEHKVVPITYLPEIHAEYFHPSFAEHQPGTMYALNNAFTYALRSAPPSRQIAANLSVGKYFGLHGRAADATKLLLQ